MNALNNINQLNDWMNAHPILSATLLIWVIAWKGLALWKSAQRGQKYWFIALLFINTASILDIIYIYFIAKDSKVEVIKD